jgi:uncharacterized membrane protein YphA (DoxX/SURF4 family)
MKLNPANGAARVPRQAMTKHALTWLLRIFLGALIFATGAGKALDIAGFAEIIRTYRLGLADDLLLPIGFGIAALELGLGTWLFAGRWLIGAARLSIAVNAGYCLLLTSALWRGLDLDNCGCFGVHLASPLRWYSPLESLALVSASYLLRRLARK